MGLTVFDIVLVAGTYNTKNWTVNTGKSQPRGDACSNVFFRWQKKEIKTLLKMKEKDLSTEHRNQSTHLGSCDPPERNESQPE